jgi:F0F1-type ATP synthase assembly protein I
MTQSKDEQQKAINTMLIVMVGQVGCLALVVILLALFGGLWLDKYLDSRPLFTVGFLLGSVPVTLFLMYRAAKAATDRIKPVPNKTEMSTPKEDFELD